MLQLSSREANEVKDVILHFFSAEGDGTLHRKRFGEDAEFRQIQEQFLLFCTHTDWTCQKAAITLRNLEPKINEP